MTTAQTTIHDDEAGTMILAPWHGPEGGYALWHKGDVVWMSAGMWRPINETPDRPMPVIYYSITRDFGGEGPRYPEPAFAGQPYRDERCDLGYWDGKDWCFQGTGHAVWENPEDDGDPDLPTHWMPLPSPPTSEQTDD